MTGVLIKMWDLSLSEREISLLIPLETSIEETVQELVGWGALSSLVDRESVEHTREVVEDILAGRYNYTWDTHLGLRSGADTATADDDNNDNHDEDITPDDIVTKIKTESDEDPLDIEKSISSMDLNTLLPHTEIVKREKIEKPKKGSAKKLPKNTVFNCEVCGKEFNRKQRLLRHMVIHTGEKPHVCDTCGNKFTQKSSLDYHVRCFHSGVRFPCDIDCSEEFESKQLLKQHQQEAHQEYYCDRCSKAYLTDHNCDLHKCDDCGKEYKGVKLLKQHMKTHTGEKEHVCDICGKKFTQKYSLTKHVRLFHSGVRLFPCDINCSEQFESRQLLKQHQRESHQDYFCSVCSKAFLNEHTCPKPEVFRCDIDCSQEFESKQLLKEHQRETHPEYYCSFCTKAFLGDHTCDLHKCEVCGKDFKGKKLLRRHMMIHTGDKRYVCDTCGKKFHLQCHLTRHIKLAHADGCKLCKCEVCGKDFKGKHVLKLHMLIHTGEKPHVCDTCGKKFTQKTTLVKHVMFVHSEVKHPCDQCDAEFKDHRYLEHHKKFVHSGVVENVCNICSRSFVIRRHLLNHMQSVHEEKSLFCPVCEKGFAFLNELKKHMLTHMDKKTQICDICHMGFYKRESLLRHRKRVHGEKKFVCDVCKIGFTTNYYLTRHRQTHKDPLYKALVDDC